MLTTKKPEKNRFITVEPSRFPISGYVRLKMRCCCCRRLMKEHDGAEYRKEDLDQILQGNPICKNCAKHYEKTKRKTTENAVAELQKRTKIEYWQEFFYGLYGNARPLGVKNEDKLLLSLILEAKQVLVSLGANKRGNP